MTANELREILNQENNRPDEMATEWATVSFAAAIRAMMIAYNKGTQDAGGLTKREIFTTAAMQGLITSYFSKEPHLLGIPDGKEYIAEWSIAYADELLKQLEK
jgi:hypothetical protein